MDVVTRVDVLFNRIRLRLDETRDADTRVIVAMQALMDDRSSELWIERRDALVHAAVAAFRQRWLGVFPASLEPAPPA